MSQTDYLTKDSLLPEGQRFVCLSFLTPSEEDKHTLTGIKIRGVFPTYEMACEHAKKLQSVDKYFNVFVGDMGSWLPFDPNPDSKFVKDSEYANQELNKMMRAYQENQEKAKIFHEQRKNEKIRQNIESNIQTHNKNKKTLKKKLKNAKSKEEKKSISFNLDNIEEQLKQMEQKHKEVAKQEKDCVEKLSVKKD